MNPVPLLLRRVRLSGLALGLVLPLCTQAQSLFRFGPSADYVTGSERFLGLRSQPLDWGPKRLFSDRVPLTPPTTTPAVFGGFEFYNATGNLVFVDYKGKITTGVNDNSFANGTLDSLGVKSGFARAEEARDVSFALGFLVLGRLSAPATAGELAVSTRLSYRMIGPVPGSARVVVRAGDAFYASDFAVELKTTRDRTVRILARDLASAPWRRYDPTREIAFDSEAPTATPTGNVDFAGVLITRVVNAPKVQAGEFDVTEVAELVVDSSKR